MDLLYSQIIPIRIVLDLHSVHVLVQVGQPLLYECLIDGSLMAREHEARDEGEDDKVEFGGLFTAHHIRLGPQDGGDRLQILDARLLNVSFADA